MINYGYDFRIRIVKEGRKRKLIINDAKVTDGGLFACTSNADKTEAEIDIKCKSIFYGSHIIVICSFY